VLVTAKAGLTLKHEELAHVARLIHSKAIAGQSELQKCERPET